MSDSYPEWYKIEEAFIQFGTSEVFTNFFDNQKREVVTICLDNHGEYDGISQEDLETERKLYDEIMKEYGTRFWQLPRVTSRIDFMLMEEFATKNDPELERVLLTARHPMSQFNQKVADLDLLSEWYKFKDGHYRQLLLDWARDHGIACPDE